MDKEKLIEHINKQEKGLDEREVAIKNSSYVWAHWGVYAVLVVIYILRAIKGIEFTYDLVMIMMGQAGFMSYSLYRDGRNKKMNLIFTIISVILFLLATYLTMGNYGII